MTKENMLDVIDYMVTMITYEDQVNIIIIFNLTTAMIMIKNQAKMTGIHFQLR